MLECGTCGVIYRSRQHWYGNPGPESIVMEEVRHIWPEVCLPATSIQITICFHIWFLIDFPMCMFACMDTCMDSCIHPHTHVRTHAFTEKWLKSAQTSQCVKHQVWSSYKPPSSYSFCPHGLTFMWWGCCGLCFWHKATKLAHSFCFCSCVCFSLYDPFSCILFHKFFQQLSTFSLCSSSLTGPFNYISL